MRVKLILKMHLANWIFDIVLKGFGSFNAENLGSVGQRAAKWPAIKLWEWFDSGTTRIRADWFESGRGQMADFFLRPSTLTASNFDALWPKDPIFTVLKDLNLLKRYFKNQEAGSILRVIFALSFYIINWWKGGLDCSPLYLPQGFLYFRLDQFG